MPSARASFEEDGKQKKTAAQLQPRPISAQLNIMATSKFEQKRIKELKDERETIQKKTFTKWMNSFLDKVLIGYL